jgi:hypothetical protein
MQSFYDHEANTVDGTTGFNYNRSTSLYIYLRSLRVGAGNVNAKTDPFEKKKNYLFFPHTMCTEL